MSLHTLVGIIVVLVVVGCLLYLVEVIFKFSPVYIVVIRVLAGLFLFLYILSALGLWSGFVA